MKVIKFMTFNHVQDRKINSSHIGVMLSFRLPGKNFLTQNEYWYNSSMIGDLCKLISIRVHKTYTHAHNHPL